MRGFLYGVILITKQDFMDLAFKLALKGKGKTWTNPLVGAVIVKNGEILATGYHHQFGKEHAEIDALNRLENINAAFGATMYVSMEPCSHFGKTPPCAIRLVEVGIKKVVIGQLDPNPLVSGKGVSILKNAGIEVTNLNLKLPENLKYNFYYNRGRPYITVKYAMTLDGKINRQSNLRSFITGNEVFADSQQLRLTNQAILVGENTALTDNPSLSVRNINTPYQPWRVVVANNADQLPNNLKIFQDHLKTIVLSRTVTKKRWPKGINIVIDSKWNPKKIAEYLAKIGVQSLLIEGGSHLHAEFIASNLVDEIIVYVAPKIFGGQGLPAVQGKAAQSSNFQLVSREFIGLDTKFKLRRM